MNATDSIELLREFARTNSEAAFDELVRRHLDLVYSAALRQSRGDAALAADVAQTVFTDLVKQVRRPRGGGASVLTARSLSGWLYQHACFVTSNALRTEVRRRAREETAMQIQNPGSDPDWSSIALELDEALNQLADPDRDALVMRYFEKASFARVGAALGATEDAARMRVDRALDKLRDQLVRRGVTSTAGALATSLSILAVTPAPAGLAGVIKSAALAAPAAGGIASLLGTKSVATALGVTLTASLVLVAWLGGGELRRQNSRLSAESAALKAELLRLQSDLAGLRQAIPTAEDQARLASAQVELLRLRGEVARLRREQAGAAAPGIQPNGVGESAPEAAEDEPIQIEVSGRFLELEVSQVRRLSNVSREGEVNLTETEARALIEAAEKMEGVKLLSSPRLTTLSGRQARIEMHGDQGKDPVLDVLPTAAEGGRQISLMLKAGYLLPGEGTPDSVVPNPVGGNWIRATVTDGQSILLHQSASAWVNAAEGRSLLVLVTATSIGPTGARLHPPEEASGQPDQTSSPSP